MLRITFFLSPSQSDCGRPSLGGWLLAAGPPEESQRSFCCEFAVASTSHEKPKTIVLAGSLSRARPLDHANRSSITLPYSREHDPGVEVSGHQASTKTTPPERNTSAREGEFLYCTAYP